MKKLLIFAMVALFSTTCICAQEADLTSQDDGLTKDFTVSGTVQIGSNYTPLLGIKLSENFALYTEVSAFHKSGLGVAYFAFDDFCKDSLNLTGRTRFIDLAYAKPFGEKVFMYSAMEYVWYDNWKDGESLMPYVIVTYTPNTWSYEGAAMLTYFPHFDEDKYEVTAYGKVTKTLWKDLEINVTGYYDSIYKDHFYGSLGAKVNLPSGFFVTGNLLYRDSDLSPFVNLGWNFGK